MQMLRTNILYAKNNIFFINKLHRYRIVVFGQLGWILLKIPLEVNINFDPFSLLLSSGPGNKHLLVTTGHLLNNAMLDTSYGHFICVEIRGVGYKFRIKDSKVYMILGYSHLVEFIVPAGLQVSIVDVKSMILKLSGSSRQLVHRVAAQLCLSKLPDCYKGKGVWYKGKKTRLKAGKKSYQ